jgi:outer membrane protein OmpA-like peptidoglycan-associated protein
VQGDVQGVKADQAAMSQKFGQLGDYDVKGEVTVYFAVSSATLSEDSKQQLKQLADKAVQLKGYMVQVAGYTDSSGNASYNQELSDRRAEAVVNYLLQCARFRRIASWPRREWANQILPDPTSRSKASRKIVASK